MDDTGNASHVLQMPLNTVQFTNSFRKMKGELVMNKKQIMDILKGFKNGDYGYEETYDRIFYPEKYRQSPTTSPDNEIDTRKAFLMEIDEIHGNPICFMVWEMDMISQDCTLAVVLTDRTLAEKYSKYIRDNAKQNDRQVRVHIEDREMNHMFGASMMDKIGLPLKKSPFPDEGGNQ